MLSCLFLCMGTYAQNDSTRLRLVDSLRADQKSNRVLLKSELDSLLKLYGKPVEPQQVEHQQPLTQEAETDPIWPVLAGLGLVLLLIIYSIYRSGQQAQYISSLLERQHHSIEKFNSQPATATGPMVTKEPAKPQKAKLTTLESKIQEQTKAIEKLTAENEQLLEDVKDMAGFKTMYQEVVDGVTKTFKVKNYPHNGDVKTEHGLLLAWLDTERAFTTNVYEKYVKPVHAILEANKKDPAHTPNDEKNKLAELLVSVSLLYMEYLYLRVAELSIGGKIVDRINLIKKAAAINAATLKQLDVEHGSKALVLHLALREKNIGPLSYPVLDETNLNRK
jgi:hypothetical protein